MLQCFLVFNNNHEIGHICSISQGSLLINDFQSHPVFAEYHDLLEDLEEKLSSVANLED